MLTICFVAKVDNTLDLNLPNETAASHLVLTSIDYFYKHSINSHISYTLYYFTSAIALRRCGRKGKDEWRKVSSRGGDGVLLLGL